MRIFVVILLLSVPLPAVAAQWFCQSDLEATSEPRSALAFRLILEESGTFQAEGRRAHHGFGWHGTYTRFEDQVAFIGDLTTHDAAVETRAHSEHVQDNVLILSLQENTQAPLMVRCLRHDLR